MFCTKIFSENRGAIAKYSAAASPKRLCMVAGLEHKLKQVIFKME
jgi:hypothetical protein